MTQVTILTAARGMPATKSFIRDEVGNVAKLPMRMSKHFTVERREIDTIRDLAEVLTELNFAPNKLVIRGEPIGPITDAPVRRLKYSGDGANATFRSSAQRWACFDFDKIDRPDHINPASEPVAALQYLADLLPAEFQNVSFFARWSSSAGMDGWATLSAHLWFMLDRPVTDAALSLWAEELPIDRRLFNAVQPHFTAAPIFAFDVADPCPTRCHLIKGQSDVVAINLAETNDAERVAENPRGFGFDTEGTRSADRAIGTEPGSRHPKVGSGRRQNQRCRSDGPEMPKRTLLSERIRASFKIVSTS